MTRELRDEVAQYHAIVEQRDVRIAELESAFEKLHSAWVEDEDLAVAFNNLKHVVDWGPAADSVSTPALDPGKLDVDGHRWDCPKLAGNASSCTCPASQRAEANRSFHSRHPRCSYKPLGYQVERHAADCEHSDEGIDRAAYGPRPSESDPRTIEHDGSFPIAANAPRPSDAKTCDHCDAPAAGSLCRKHFDAAVAYVQCPNDAVIPAVVNPSAIGNPNATPVVRVPRREPMSQPPRASNADRVLSNVMTVLNESLRIGAADFDPVWAARELARRANDGAALAPSKRNPNLKRCAACGSFAVAGAEHTAECPLRHLSAAETPSLQRPDNPTPEPVIDFASDIDWEYLAIDAYKAWSEGNDITGAMSDIMGAKVLAAKARSEHKDQRPETPSVTELEALRGLCTAVSQLVAANDESLGWNRPRSDIAWRDVKRAYEALSSVAGSTGT